MSGVEVVVALVIAFGLVGIVVPVVPGGSLLIAAAVLGWAWWRGATVGWVVFGVVAAIIAAGIVGKYAVPGRRLKDAGIPVSTQLIGALVGFVGFFVVPMVGLFLGFVVGVYAAEVRRLGRDRAWGSTRTALRAVGLAILIELAAGVLATGAWIFGLLAT